LSLEINPQSMVRKTTGDGMTASRSWRDGFPQGQQKLGIVLENDGSIKVGVRSE